MPAYGGPRCPIVQLLHRMWPRRSTIAELVPHYATPGEFSASHHPEAPSPGSLKNVTPLTVVRARALNTVPSASRKRRYGLPRGKAARATAAVDAGTSEQVWGRRDIASLQDQ